jgi:serine/threonine protein phosphatase PrpC
MASRGARGADPPGFGVGIATARGSRGEMQDRHAVTPGAGGLFAGVYDGHGGSRVARALAADLHRFFFAALAEAADPEAAFARAFARMDAAVVDVHCGSTATALFLQGSRLTVANLGDGRVLRVGTSGAETLTRDHRGADAQERARVLAAGGRFEPPYVMRGDYGLMVTRSLGDRWFRPVGVIAVPEVTSRLVGPEDRLVVACDGLWDELDAAEVVTAVRAEPDPQAAADALAAAVAARRGRDNLTVLVIPARAARSPG